VYPSVKEDVGAHFLLDQDILFRGVGRLRREVRLAMLLFLCRILGMGDELVVGEKELMKLLDVGSERVPSGLLGMGERAPEGGSKIGYPLLVTATGTRHFETLSAPRESNKDRDR
jgi:hypothetical protein